MVVSGQSGCSRRQQPIVASKLSADGDRSKRRRAVTLRARSGTSLEMSLLRRPTSLRSQFYVTSCKMRRTVVFGSPVSAATARVLRSER